jgi:hypothetical protein
MKELEFWENRHVNPWVTALSLWAASGDYDLGIEVIARAFYTDHQWRADFANE